MSVIIKDLGPVTAYAFAKEHGYTGTETQFGDDQAHFSQNATYVRSVAFGDTGTRQDEETDNVKYYYEKIKEYYENIGLMIRELQNYSLVAAKKEGGN